MTRQKILQRQEAIDAPGKAGSQSFPAARQRTRMCSRMTELRALHQSRNMRPRRLPFNKFLQTPLLLMAVMVRFQLPAAWFLAEVMYQRGKTGHRITVDGCLIRNLVNGQKHPPPNLVKWLPAPDQGCHVQRLFIQRPRLPQGNGLPAVLPARSVH